MESQTPVDLVTSPGTTRSLLTAAECVSADRGCSSTAVAHPPSQLIHRLFEERAARTPEAVALLCEHRRLTYRQLNDRANQVARALLAHGVRPDDRIAIHADRSMELVIGLLGILKAGGAYVPVDPGYPDERLRSMLRDCSPVVLLSRERLTERAGSLDVATILLDRPLPYPPDNVCVTGQTSRNLAYVMYTSGSTGQPKGVMVEHRSVLGLVVNSSFASIGPEDCIAHCASPSFDASTWEIWAALLNGARLLVIPTCVVLDPVALNRTLCQYSVTAMWLTVGLFNRYVDSLERAFSGLRYLLVGGDTLDPSTLARALAKSVPPQHLLNGYGPTETTTFASTFEVTKPDPFAPSVPIGRPVENAHLYILDEHLAAVAVGAVGEIYIGGGGLSRGYLNRPSWTADRFLPDPFSSESGGRMYRSGDLGRYRADGNIDYLGRNDRQVKVRGFRVEMGEVEAHLTACDSVREAIVVARESQARDKHLVAYLTTRYGSSSSPTLLRRHLSTRLPEYMVPSAYVLLDGLPLTANGKVDRGALPEPDAYAYACVEYEAPQNALEEKLAVLWQDVLELPRIGRRDDFLDLGGHSLLAMALAAKTQEAFGIRLPFDALFNHPTIAQFSQLLEKQPLAPEEISR